MSHPDPMTPVQKAERRRSRVGTLAIASTLVLVLAYFVYAFGVDHPVDHGDVVGHFKYGSIGSEVANGLPYRIWKALPAVCPELIGGEGYDAFGFLYEREGGRERDLPIGVSRRTVRGLDRVWLNCAVCHTGSYRGPDGQRHVVPGMPANGLDLQRFIRFLTDCATSPRFRTDEVLAAIEATGEPLGGATRLLYRTVIIDRVRSALLDVRARLAFMSAPRDFGNGAAAPPPDWGPGRVDTFNPYKAIQFNFPMDALPARELIGISDLPSLWLQAPRRGMQLHWDGNNSSVEERNKSAALGAGVTPTTIDLARIKRIEDWILDARPPRYPFPVDTRLAADGADVFARHCDSCHGLSEDGAPGRWRHGDRVGTVIPLEDVGTDPWRLASYSYELLANQGTLYAGYPWRFTHFRKTGGYAAAPLDGLWLRAPYLHNGSVPTLRDLLEPPERRPPVFHRGNDVYDPDGVGFVSDLAAEDGRSFFRFDTHTPGNGNQGHLYGTDLADGEKRSLLEYLKTL